ncbi:hypothetical protein GQ457_17G001170 [Hibiscus cannabinus]
MDLLLGLCRDVTELEIRDVLFRMGKDKSPGPDGFTVGNQDNIRENPSRIFSLVFAPTPLSPGFVDFAILLASGRDVISRWDSRSNLDVSRRNQVVIFLRESCVLRYLRDPGNEEVRFLRSTIRSRRLGDQLVREFVSS